MPDVAESQKRSSDHAATADQLVRTPCAVSFSRGPKPRVIAYRLRGSANDAEDAVQDTFLRWQSADRALVETHEAWLTKVLTDSEHTQT